MEFSHKSVLLNECIENLNIKPDGIYVDGTLGGAGHSYHICERLSKKGRLIGIDQDEDAIRAATTRLEPFKDRVTIVKDNYSNIKNVLVSLGIDKVDGILLGDFFKYFCLKNRFFLSGRIWYFYPKKYRNDMYTTYTLRYFANYNILIYSSVVSVFAAAANVSEDDLADDGAGNENVAKVREFAASEGSEVFVVCAQIEEEISELEDDEKKMFLEDLGLKESGLDKLIKASYKLLGLISFLTAGPTETRAWTIKEGTKAPGAAGKIHSDFERGFIKAEVVYYKDLLECGSYAAAKEKGLVGIEGKDYVVKDGDVILFRFNV